MTGLFRIVSSIKELNSMYLIFIVFTCLYVTFEGRLTRLDSRQ
ncbi:MAG: hypothetical protein ACI9JM_002650 [Halioglobus sp.]|jgi:hypothetical protein